MKIQREIEYALELMIALARHANQVSLPDLCKEAAVPLRYGRSLMPLLTRARLVVGKSGQRGGYTMAVSPDSINAADVIEAVCGGLFTMADPAGRSPALQEIVYQLRQAAEAALKPWSLAKAAAA